MATHSSFLAWRIPWTEKPGGLQSMGLQKESDTTVQLNTHSVNKEGKQSSHAGGLGMNRWNLADGDSSHFRTNSCFCTVLYISHSK